MATYLIGDLQGCDSALEQLLDALAFDPAQDRLIVLGDAVNRGPGSLAVLRRLMALGGAAQCLLGNHDLHLLAVACGVRPAHRSDTLDTILQAPDRDDLLAWVAQRPLALHEQGWLLVHAGVLPEWSTQQALELAAEVEQQLRGPDLKGFLGELFGNQPASWSEQLRGPERWRVTVNALTRMRLLDLRGERATMDFHHKQGVARIPKGYLPWFAVPGRRSADTPIAFGHWSALGLRWSDNALCLDSGCLWGGSLSAVRLPETGTAWLNLTQVRCASRLDPLDFASSSAKLGQEQRLRV